MKEANIFRDLVFHIVSDLGRCSRHLTMTNDATDGTRLYTSRVIPQLLLATSDDGMQLTSCHYCRTSAAVACCSPPLTRLTLRSAHAASLCFVSGHNFLCCDLTSDMGRPWSRPAIVTLTKTTLLSSHAPHNRSELVHIAQSDK